MTGWISAAAGFLFLALSNLGWNFYYWYYARVFVAISLLIAGGLLFWSEKAKSALIFVLGGLHFLFFLRAEDLLLSLLRGDGVIFFVIFLWPFLGAVFYFKATRLREGVIKNFVILAVLQLLPSFS